MNKLLLFKPLTLHFFKIIALYLIGYLLASHYRPIQNSQGFQDLGVADSGVGLVSLMAVYLIFTPPSRPQAKAKKNAIIVLSVYLIQEIYCYFFPGFVGTFDFKDLVYYVFGFMLIYWFDVRERKVV
ncbi:hypothetical protein [Pararhodonellum marinum]|uniref:hypothetical protein n=1 Tax=Pararhodonellum marinum TaxID=2755358 RepID=UPI00188DDE54|nr:hypothetical protein [Pararhodonellum marinum]